MTSKPLLLLDTHIWFWWVTGNSKLPRQIGQAIEANDRPIGIACVSVYELVFLIQKQRIYIDLPLDEWLHAATVEAGLRFLIRVMKLPVKPPCCRYVTVILWIESLLQLLCATVHFWQVLIASFQPMRCYKEN